MHVLALQHGDGRLGGPPESPAGKVDDTANASRRLVSPGWIRSSCANASLGAMGRKCVIKRVLRKAPTQHAYRRPTTPHQVDQRPWTAHLRQVLLSAVVDLAALGCTSGGARSAMPRRRPAASRLMRNTPGGVATARAPIASDGIPRRVESLIARSVRLGLLRHSSG